MGKCRFQQVTDRSPDRKDHVWLETFDGFKCCLCGAFTVTSPPPYPTPDWTPLRYLSLTDAERSLCPGPVHH